MSDQRHPRALPMLLQHERAENSIGAGTSQDAHQTKLQAAVNHTRNYIEKVQNLQADKRNLYMSRAQMSLPSISPTRANGKARQGTAAGNWSNKLQAEEELKHTARQLHVFKLRRAALDPRELSSENNAKTPHLLGHDQTDYATRSFCRSIAMEIVQNTLKRVDNRPEVPSVRKEQRQWQVSKQELEQGYTHQLLFVILTKVVRECIQNVVEEIRADLQLPQAFAMRLLTKAVAATRRGGELHRSQHGVYEQVLKHMQSERDSTQPGNAAKSHRSILPLKAVLPPDFPKWAQACITGSTAGNSGANSSSQWHSKIIRHGEPPGELHIQASGVEERYWSEAQFLPYGKPVALQESLGDVTDLAAHPAGFCIAVCTGHGHMKVFDVRCSQVREIYHHNSNSSAPASTSKGRRRAAKAKTPQIEFCGIAFGAGAHLAATTSDGSVVPFLMRPHASSSDNPDSVLVPMALLMLRPDAQAMTGKSKLFDPVLSVALTTQQASKLQKDDEEGQQAVTLKLRPCYLPTFTLSGSTPHIVLPQGTGDILSIRIPISGPILPAKRSTWAALDQQHKGLQLAQAANPTPAVPLSQQRLHRHHDAYIVYVAPFRANGAFLSVDLMGGVVAWPPLTTPKNAMGWIQPVETFSLARVIKVPQLGEQMNVLEPEGNIRADAENVNKPWLVMYTRQGTGAVRIAVSQPSPHQSAGHHCLASVVHTTKYGTSQQLEQSGVRVAYSSVPTQVVGAQLSSDRSMLVIVTMVRAAESRDVAWGTYFRFQAVSCRDWSISLPVIDVVDSSGGGLAAPIFSIRQLVVSLGSEYLFAALGLDVVGIYSITSGQLLRELPLSTAAVGAVPAGIIQLSVFMFTSYYGMDTTGMPAALSEDGVQCKQWKVLIAAVLGAPAHKLILFQMQEDNAELAALEYRRSEDSYTTS